jgi:rubrerythrin
MTQRRESAIKSSKAAAKRERGRLKSGRLKMAEQILRCPYCILGNDFRPMLQRPDWYVCEQCGHTVIPVDPEFKCSCRKCLELNRVA